MKFFSRSVVCSSHFLYKGMNNVPVGNSSQETMSVSPTPERSFQQKTVEQQVNFLLDATLANVDKETALNTLRDLPDGLIRLTQLEQALDNSLNDRAVKKESLTVKVNYLGSKIDDLQKKILESSALIHVDVKDESVQNILKNNPSMGDLFEPEKGVYNSIAITLIRHAESFGLDSQNFTPKQIAAHKLISLLDDRLNKQKEYGKKSFKEAALVIFAKLDYEIVEDFETTLKELNFEFVENKSLRKRVGRVLTLLPDFKIPGESDATAKAYADNIFPFFKMDGQKYVFPNVVQNKLEGIVSVSDEALSLALAKNCQLLDAMADGKTTVKSGTNNVKNATERFYDFMYKNREISIENVPLAEIQAQLTIQELVYRYVRFEGDRKNFSVTKNTLSLGNENSAPNIDKWEVDEYARYNLVNNLMFGKRIPKSVDKQVSNAGNNLQRLLIALEKYTDKPDDYLDDIVRAIRPKSTTENIQGFENRAVELGKQFDLYKKAVGKISSIKENFKNQELTPTELGNFKEIEKKFFCLIIDNMEEIRNLKTQNNSD